MQCVSHDGEDRGIQQAKEEKKSMKKMELSLCGTGIRNDAILTVDQWTSEGNGKKMIAKHDMAVQQKTRLNVQTRPRDETDLNG